MFFRTPPIGLFKPRENEYKTTKQYQEYCSDEYTHYETAMYMFYIPTRFIKHMACPHAT